jgi:DNA replication and repair protein RecF
MELVTGSGSVRRRFLDFSGSQCEPGYRAALRSYEKALRSRNALLREGRPRREIEAFDHPLVESGSTLRSARERIVSRLAPLASAACTEISGQGDSLTLEYRPGCAPDFASALADSRREEDRLRSTVVGPHRDDFSLLLGALPAGTYASEGQQRSIALSLKLAQARDLEQQLERPPIFLLDDVFGELDPARRNRLLAALPPSAQVLITTTFLDWALETGDVWHLDGGKIHKS